VASKQRTSRQNRALHLFLTHISDELNEAGLTVMQTLRHDAEIPWTMERVKELMFKPIMDVYLGKNSTTKLTTKEIDKMIDVLTRYLGETHGITVLFPSIETLLNEERNKNGKV